MTYTEKILKEVEVLQSETHNDDLGIVFTRSGDKYYCSIDWQGGEMKFELGFIQQALAEERERVVGEIEKNNVQNLCHYDDRNPEYNAIMRELNDNRGRSDDCSCYNCFRGKDKIITDILSSLDKPLTDKDK